jgi:hypothetical protein
MIELDMFDLSLIDYLFAKEYYTLMSKCMKPSCTKPLFFYFFPDIASIRFCLSPSKAIAVIFNFLGLATPIL